MWSAGVIVDRGPERSEKASPGEQRAEGSGLCFQAGPSLPRAQSFLSVPSPETPDSCSPPVCSSSPQPLTPFLLTYMS